MSRSNLVAVIKVRKHSDCKLDALEAQVKLVPEGIPAWPSAVC
jgi:hypothetical protein